MKILKAWERVFVSQYVENGQNGKIAYMVARPTAKPDSAKASAHKLMKRPYIENAIQDALSPNLPSTGEGPTVTLEDVTAKLLSVYDEARKNEQLEIARKTLNDLARLHKLDGQQVDEAVKYQQLIVNLFSSGLTSGREDTAITIAQK